LMVTTGDYWRLLEITTTGNYTACRQDVEVTRHYRGLLEITRDYWRLLEITRDYWRLL